MQKNLISRICGWLLFITVFICSAANGLAIVADPVKLGWNPASDVSVKGYIIYYGATNQPTTNRIVAGTNLTVTLNNLQAGVTYKIYATSYNVSGVESLPSNQVLLTATVAATVVAPTGPKLKLTRQSNGTTKLDYKMAPGASCAVQFSADMKPGSWRMLTNVTANQLGDIIATDSSAAQVMRRFYRVVHSPQPLLSAISIVRLPDSKMHLSFTAPPGARCEIEYAPNSSSSTWKFLVYATADAEGNIALMDPSAPIGSSRFYRALLR